MSDRTGGFLVILEKDIREDDAEPIASLLGMIKGVIDVRTIPDNISATLNKSRIRHELITKLYKALEE